MAAENSLVLKAALERTDPELARRIDSEWLRGEWQLRGDRVALYRRYTTGDHDSNYTEQQKKMLRINTGTSELNDFVINYMSMVVDKYAGRLDVNKIDLGNDTANEWAAERMDAADFEAMEGMVFRGAIRDAHSYIIVDPKTNIPKCEPAYDGQSGVVAVYGMDGNIQWAAKLWSEGTGESNILTGDEANEPPSQITYCIVYQPDKISAWQSEGGSLSAYDYFGEGVSEVSWLVGRVPVIQFTNKKDNYTYYGESEIRPGLSLQNVLNRTLASSLMVEEFGAFPVNVIIGAALSIGALVPGTVLSLPLKDASGNVVTSPDESQIALINAIKHFTMQPAQLQPYLEALEKFVVQLSHTTQTPIYGVTSGGGLSGDALKQLEIGLIGKVERFQRENSDAVKEMFLLMRDIQSAYNIEGLGNPPQFDAVSVQWKSAELRDQNADLTALILMYEKTPGLFPKKFYQQRIGAILGLSETQVQQYADEAMLEDASRFANLLTGGGGEGGMELV